MLKADYFSPLCFAVKIVYTLDYLAQFSFAHVSYIRITIKVYQQSSERRCCSYVITVR